MVQLTTTYDQTINRKVFVLKGEEAYAKTTDTILNVIEFEGDRTLTHYHLGLEVAVYRMEGDTAGVEIYRNDEVVKVIPWAEEMSASVIADDDTLEWDEVNKVVRWGSDDDLESGLILDYDTDNHFYAKFVGNKQCLKSESKHFNYNLPLPANFEAKIEFSLDDRDEPIYILSETTSINATLTDIEDTPIVGETIKWYDGSTLLGTTTTDSDGATQSPNITGSALHNIRAVFDGNTNHYAVENTIQVSKGYVIDVDYDKFWLGGRGSVTGTVTDYFDNAIINEKIICILNQSDALIDFTDNDGKVTLTNTRSTIVVSPPFTLRTEYGDRSEEFSPIVASVSESSITPIRDFVTTGQTISLTAHATGVDRTTQNPVSFEGMEVTVSDCTPSSITLDSNGNSTTYYTGTSSGDKQITAIFNGQAGSTTTIHDLLQYANVNSQYSNINVTTSGNASFNKVTNGYKITKNSQSTPAIVFKDDYVADATTDFVFEFELVYINQNDSSVVTVGTHNEYTGSSYSHIIENAHSGDVIRLERVNKTHKYYVNGTLVQTASNCNAWNPEIIYLSNMVSGNIIINNIKWWLI